MIISITLHSSSDSVNSAETSNVFFTLGAGESELNDAMMQPHVCVEAWRGYLVAFDTQWTLGTPVCACVRTH